MRLKLFISKLFLACLIRMHNYSPCAYICYLQKFHVQFAPKIIEKQSFKLGFAELAGRGRLNGPTTKYFSFFS